MEKRPIRKEERLPRVSIVNWPDQGKELNEKAEYLFEPWNPWASLPDLLRDAVVAAEVPGVERSGITVTYGGEQVLKDDRTIILIVEGLFDRPDRTKEVRDRLALKLAEAAKGWVATTWRVEVLVKRFDPEKDSYCLLEGEAEEKESE